MARKNVYTIRGVANWAKILGDPVDNYAKDGKEWTMDITPDKDGMKTIEDLGLTKKIKNKEDDRGDFIQFRQRATRLDGSQNRRISVSDAAGHPWPDNELIGNGSVVDVKFEFKDYGEGKHPGVYPQAVRVLDHKAYERVEFAPLAQTDPYAGKVGAATKSGQLPEEMEPANDDEFPE